MMFVLVVGSVSTLEAAHIHGEWLPGKTATLKSPALSSQGQGEERCPLCVAMHSALPVSRQVAPEPLEEVAQAFAVHPVDASQRQWSFAMFSRPPPVVEWTIAAGTAS